MNNPREIPKELIEYANTELQHFLNTVAGIDFVMLCSSDGFELCLASKKNIENTGKIAAVSSSILAMVNAFITEIQLLGCQTITLDADNGKVFLTAVHHPQHPMVMVAVTNTDILMGQMLYYYKELSARLSSAPLSLAS
ncbi:roadblock/LC7 domain-containing protein [Acinetobacter johnsonii]|uniref:Roadblock/LC7 domain-containing protein n=1 Tax=Acinetobacter johnsonii TaxID=40214 RepID=A0AA42MVZ9_ACIJO|nr:roadblock/LC7 domain-containing protein [Acinetobacter johnsonii]MDH0969745.1 roadblock/LC7 domain-containing protein [Acinetobacter johnsonii]QYA54300.1 roadblock/LC7 domain-containing protein [Acinetobacter johnsonii]WQN46507.1 roadblock/LC7 domain-containing protein [Acinetobacter johnsonii]